MKSAANTILESYRLIVEETAAQHAHRLGLKYAGFGYWNDQHGKRVAQTDSQADKLVFFTQQGEPTNGSHLPTTEPGKKTPQAKKTLSQSQQPAHDPYLNVVPQHKKDKLEEQNPKLEDLKFNKPVDAGKFIDGARAAGRELHLNFTKDHPVSGQKGTNPGGFFELNETGTGKELPGHPGHKFYIKTYANAEQGICETFSDQVYRLLGISVPDTNCVVSDDNKIAHTSRIVAGETLQDAPPGSVTRKDARKFLKGFLADVWLSNWDVMGYNNDNVLKSGNTLLRIDNGSSLLYRAQGTKKTHEQLMNVTEFENFNNPRINRHYVKMMETAGYKSPKDMGVHLLDQMHELAKFVKRPLFSQLFFEMSGWGNRWEVKKLLEHRLQQVKDKVKPVSAYIAEKVMTNAPEAADLLNDYSALKNYIIPGESKYLDLMDGPGTEHPINKYSKGLDEQTFEALQLDANKQSREFRTHLKPNEHEKLLDIQDIWQSHGQWDGFDDHTRFRATRHLDEVINGLHSLDGKQATVELPEGASLFRGMKLSAGDMKNFLDNFKIGETVQLPTAGYSADSYTAMDFTNSLENDTSSVILKVNPSGRKLAGLHLSHTTKNFGRHDVPELPPDPFKVGDKYMHDELYRQWKDKHGMYVQDTFDKERSNWDDELEIVRPSNANLRVKSIKHHILVSPSMGFAGGPVTNHFYEIEMDDEGLGDINQGLVPKE